MRRRSIGASKRAKAQRRKTTARKSRVPTNAASPRTSSVAVKETAVARLTRQLNEAYQQQTATAEVLKVISRATFDLQTVLNTLVKTAALLCEADLANIWRPSGSSYHLAASFGIPGKDKERQANKAYLESIEIEPGRGSTVGRVLLEKRPVQISDVQADPDYLLGKIISIGDYRTSLGVPLMREGEPIGVITLMRCTVQPFTVKQIELVSTFANQAVIAIENARLFEEVHVKTRDLEEAMVHLTGGANILSVIASSPTDIAPVLDAIAKSACEFCDAADAAVLLKEGDQLRFRAHHGSIPLTMDARPINRDWVNGRTVIDKVPIHVHDFFSAEGDDFPQGREMAARRMVRTILSVPLLHENEAIGAIALRRIEAHPFSDKQIALLRTFANQAAIAIQNVKLFDEVRAKSRDLEESLQQQTATSEVLQIISSSPGNLAPVFDKMLENAIHVCGAEFGTMMLLEDGVVRPVARYNNNPAFAAMRGDEAYRPPPGSVLATAIETKNVAQIADLRTNPAYIEGARSTVDLVELGGARSVVVVPMLRDNEVIGTITIYRQEVRPFSDKQIELLSNFAKQAVIAIVNTQLLKELRQSLQQQTATADVLKTISRSSIELETVLDTLVETAARLCNADQALIASREGDGYRTLSQLGNSPEQAAVQRNHVYTPGRGTVIGRVLLGRGVVQIADIAADPEYTMHENVTLGGTRTVLGVPLLREGEPIGVLNVARRRVEPFTERQIELMRTFADQALIAIENARLFDELRERQAELRVTFDNMGDAVVMFDAAARLTAWNRNLQEMLELPEDFLARRPNVVEYFRYLAERGEYSADLEAQLSRTIDDLSQEMRFERTRPDGRVMEVRRNPVPGGGFVLIYADITRRKQAEEAIRAARDAAETALRNLQMAQTSLVHAQKMAALGQLTAGIAHEIKNPLNFVNNFSELSVELADELIGVLEQASLADKLRKEADELTSLLKDNLGKVVQHGKRADSIVKNMLLHSREGSGEHRPVEINAIIDESLNLAYHGARAEKQGFNITLERDFDPAVGVADIYPQEVTRVLLNLISNGFYAATKRAAATNGFEPRLKAVTRNLGDNVEIRIRDNGTGIPPDIQEKIFNPFFTTKPAGEGTGLGLSMSHDIVVKQHRGTIEVVTEPGSFTEFIITLPRIMPAQPD